VVRDGTFQPFLNLGRYWCRTCGGICLLQRRYRVARASGNCDWEFDGDPLGERFEAKSNKGQSQVAIEET
jgi:hypothetical protein